VNTNIFYVYEHWRPDTGVCFYVGKGKNKRAYKMTDRSDHHQKIINKLSSMGMCVEIKLFVSGITEAEAFEIEKSRIAHWRSLGTSLCNKTDGGDGVSGLIMSDASKEKMRAAKIGQPATIGTTGMKFSDETKEKMSAIKKGKKPNNYGKKYVKKPLTEEHKLKLSLAKKGRKLSEKHKLAAAIGVKKWWASRKAEANQ